MADDEKIKAYESGRESMRRDLLAAADGYYGSASASVPQKVDFTAK